MKLDIVCVWAHNKSNFPRLIVARLVHFSALFLDEWVQVCHLETLKHKCQCLAWSVIAMYLPKKLHISAEWYDFVALNYLGNTIKRKTLQKQQKTSSLSHRFVLPRASHLHQSVLSLASAATFPCSVDTWLERHSPLWPLDACSLVGWHQKRGEITKQWVRLNWAPSLCLFSPHFCIPITSVIYNSSTLFIRLS